MKLCLRKIKTLTSNNKHWILFPEGKIDKPICLLNEFECGDLLQDILTETEFDKEKNENYSI